MKSDIVISSLKYEKQQRRDGTKQVGKSSKKVYPSAVSSFPLVSSRLGGGEVSS